MIKLNAKMQKNRKENQFIKQPFFEGGNKAFRNFVLNELKYPKEAIENKVEGIVHLKAHINHLGEVFDAKVISGIGYGCDEEAKRIIALAKYIVPKTPRKMRVKFQKNVRIQFALSMVKKKVKPQPNSTNMSISYNVVQSPKKPKAQSEPKKQSIAYNYTINIKKG